MNVLLTDHQHLSSKGVTAEEWTKAVSEVIGGKTGGKEPTRQGAGAEPAKLEQAIEEAEKWLSKKLEELKI
jgi:alanyl-tRNA synthetase